MDVIWVIVTVCSVYSKCSFCFPSLENTSITRCLDEPPSIENGKYKPYHEIFSSIVSYECDDGFTLNDSGSSKVQCLSGKWEGTPPTCKDNRCFQRDLQNTFGLLMDDGPTSSWQYMAVRCANGFTPNSNAPFCLKGEWYEYVDPCIKKRSCDPPRRIENGQEFYSALEFGSELWYRCENGFILRQLHPRVCEENGTWSGEEPVCQAVHCYYPDAPEHGFVKVIGDIPSVDSKAIFTCDGARVLIGSNTSTCLKTKEWSFPTPKCLDSCSVPKVAHGRIGRREKSIRKTVKLKEMPVGTYVENGDKLYLLCENKYEALRNSSRVGQIMCNNGEWSDFPRCEPASCRKFPPHHPTARIKSINREHGGAVVYHCLRNYNRTKKGSVSCDFGIWIGNKPVCSDTRCYLNETSFPGLKIGEKRTFLNGESFTPTCDSNHMEAKHNNELTCESGTWLGHLPPCITGSCQDQPPTLDHGRYIIHSRSHSSTVTYECHLGYALIEKVSSKIQCVFGKWKGIPPTCINMPDCVVQELFINTPQFVTVDKETVESVPFNQILRLRCEDNLIPQGSQTVRCAADGEWEIPELHCKSHLCFLLVI